MSKTSFRHGRAVGRKDLALLLGDRVSGESLKKGSGQGVVVDRAWLAWVIRCWQNDLISGEPFWTTTAVDLRRVWARAAEKLGVAWTPPPHGIRHLQPTLDVWLQKRSLEQVRRRGRWTGLGSVQRYTKVHRLLRDQDRLPEELREMGRRICDNPVDAMIAALSKGKIKDQSERLLGILHSVPKHLRPDDMLGSSIADPSLKITRPVEAEDPPSHRRPRRRVKSSC